MAFTQAAVAAGLDRAQLREVQAAQDVNDAAASLLLVPGAKRSHRIIHLVVLIAAGKHSEDDAHAFPWVYLRALLAEPDHWAA